MTDMVGNAAEQNFMKPAMPTRRDHDQIGSDLVGLTQNDAPWFTLQYIDGGRRDHYIEVVQCFIQRLLGRRSLAFRG